MVIATDVPDSESPQQDHFKKSLYCKFFYKDADRSYPIVKGHFDIAPT